jgi:hypothetical protein
MAKYSSKKMVEGLPLDHKSRGDFINLKIRLSISIYSKKANPY